MAVGPLVVAGPLTIVNSQPGALSDQRLPIRDLSAYMTLSAARQSLEALRISLNGDGTVTGKGAVANGAGALQLTVGRLDLNALHSALRPTRMAGPLTVSLDSVGQAIDADLRDATQGLGLAAKVRLAGGRTTFDEVRLDAGAGSARVSGALQGDAAGNYAFHAVLDRFDPLAFTANGRAAAAPDRRGVSAQRRGAGRRPAAREPIDARVNGTFDASGQLGPTLTSKVDFALRESQYNGLPLTGAGTLRLQGERLLPSHARLNIAGNDVALDGGFGQPGDRLLFKIDAQQLDRLGFGVAGTLKASGEVTGSIAHPNLSADYEAHGIVFGDERVGFAKGQAQVRDGANGVLSATVDARDVAAPNVTLETVTARLRGTRAKHTLDANAVGTVQGYQLNATLAAAGGLSQRAGKWAWNGTISQLQNQGTPSLQLQAPVTVAAAPQRLMLGATRLVLEGATLDLKNLDYEPQGIRTAGSARAVDIARLLALEAKFTGRPSQLQTDLVLDGDWDFSLSGTAASGFAQVQRRRGDISVDAGRGPAALGLAHLLARVDFDGRQGAAAKIEARASRLGNASAALRTTLLPRNGLLLPDDSAPLSGIVEANLPSLRTTGGLLGPTYIFDGALAMRLRIAGLLGKPKISGEITGDGIGATLVDEGVQLKDGVVRVAITENLVDFQQVELHGGKGVLRATGKVQLDRPDPALSAHIVADKLELFGAPDRRLSLSGQATIANSDASGAMKVDGKFVVDSALFDLPKGSAPRLGDDVVIVRSDGRTVKAQPDPLAETTGEKPASKFAPTTRIVIDLGHDFRFRGAGADLGLTGALTVTSAPAEPLQATGDVRVTDGSTYEAFGRKLAIETGYFTFNGPVGNPSINLLAMRRNQEVEAGVRVRGTVSAPDVQLVSEPSVTDDEKLSWLLFGHGTDSTQNLGQQSAMNAALGLLGSASGKRIAQTVGLDEFTIGQSQTGLSDSQVVSLAKALNEHFVLGYEQGLTSAASVLKLTWLLSRRWSLAVHGGTINGASLLFTERFD